MSLKALSEKAVLGFRLKREEAHHALDELLDPATHDDARKEFLLAMNGRLPSIDELTGLAEGLRAKAVPLPAVGRKPLLDTCGTGGDGLSTVNLSTAAAFVAAGAGAAVAKHGNRAVSSKSGSADVLEALGVPVDLGPQEAARALEFSGFVFLFAPRYHPALAAVGPARKALGVRTVFNLLGPLVNPAFARRQVVGVYEDLLLKTYAEALLALGAERAIVVRGAEGLDELSVCGPTRVVHADPDGGVREAHVTPEAMGLQRRVIEELRGGTAAENAAVIVAVLEGAQGAVADAVALNAAGALVVGGLADSLADGLRKAREAVASGAARAALEAARTAGKAA